MYLPCSIVTFNIGDSTEWTSCLDLLVFQPIAMRVKAQDLSQYDVYVLALNNPGKEIP